MMARNRRTRHSGGNRHGTEELRSHVAAVGRDVQELASAAGDVARQQIDPLTRYVQAQPIKSLLMAAGVGALLAMLSRRR